MTDFCSIDGRLTPLGEGLPGGVYLYQRLRTVDYRPLHTAAHLSRLRDGAGSLFGRPAELPAGRIADEIGALLHAGENQIELELMGSNRNLFGPHHFADNPEPTGVSPRTFELFGRWDADGHCDSYDPSYAFVRFGLDVCVLER